MKLHTLWLQRRGTLTAGAASWQTVFSLLANIFFVFPRDGLGDACNRDAAQDWAHRSCSGCVNRVLGFPASVCVN
jgi:hypothetical protein